MSRNRCHATALIERIARAREAQAKQELSRALADEVEQRSVAEASAGRLQDTEAGMIALMASERLDLLRTRLYQDLASAQQIASANDQKILKEREEARSMRVNELARKAHYHDRASHRALDVAAACRSLEEAKEADELIESWVLRQIGKASR